MTGPRNAGRARRAGRALDASRVEQEEQRVALAAREREVRVAGQPSTGRETRATVEGGVRDLRLEPYDEVVAQRRDARGLLRLPLRGDLRSDGERRDTGDVDGPRSHVALLTAAVEQRAQRQTATQQQRSG